MPENPVIDLRSDTVTRPTPGMRRAIADAEVGDDVFGEDPTVIRLQDRFAELMGKEAALYLPSGSMANQTAIRAQTEPGDEIIAHPESHIYHYEGAAPFALSGCSIRFVDGPRGLFTAEQVAAAVRPLDAHAPRSRLVLIENTSNRGGGTVWPIDAVRQIRDVADEHNLSMHMDGARLMNACVASGHAPADYAQYFDTVSSCFSKGLGAPVGSAVAASADLIHRIHRFRKMFGGGMRQAGVLAAAALYALDHHVTRLADDHANAQRLARALADVPGLHIDIEAVQTNILYIDLSPRLDTAGAFCTRLAGEAVRLLPVAPRRLRAVTHLDVSSRDIDRAVAVIRQTVETAVSTA